MKRIIIISIVLNFSIQTTYAQFDKIKSIKSKTEKVTKPEGNTKVENNTKSTSSSSGNSNSTETIEGLKNYNGKLDYFYKNNKENYYDVYSGAINMFPNNDKYEGLKAKYASVKPQDPEIVAIIERGDKHFNDFFPNEFIPGFKKYITTLDFFDEKKWMEEPDTYSSRIERLVSGDFLKEVAIVTKDDAWIQEVYAMMTEQKNKIMEYKNNGGVAAHREQKELEESKKVFPSKPGKDDPELVAFVKKSHKPDYYGAIQKVILVTDWKIRKDKLNYPIEKYVAIEIITKKDGKCYLISSTIYMEHEGGGKYGAKKLSRYLNNSLMDCNNYK